jgi:hypothetical protein
MRLASIIILGTFTAYYFNALRLSFREVMLPIV